jgi:hypothetical protein
MRARNSGVGDRGDNVSLYNFRWPLPSPDLEFVKVTADEGKVRAVSRV